MASSETTTDGTNPQGEYIHPNVMHFIWLGNELPKNYVVDLIEISSRALKSGYKAQLWLDDPSRLRRAIDKHPEIESIPGLEVVPIDDLLKKDGVIDKHFTKEEARALRRILTIESHGAKSPASVSDILRELILLKEGGTYSDIDNRSTQISQMLRVYLKEYFTLLDLSFYAWDDYHGTTLKALKTQLGLGKDDAAQFDTFVKSLFEAQFKILIYENSGNTALAEQQRQTFHQLATDGMQDLLQAMPEYAQLEAIERELSQGESWQAGDETELRKRIVESVYPGDKIPDEVMKAADDLAQHWLSPSSPTHGQETPHKQFALLTLIKGMDAEKCLEVFTPLNSEEVDERFGMGIMTPSNVPTEIAFPDRAPEQLPESAARSHARSQFPTIRSKTGHITTEIGIGGPSCNALISAVPDNPYSKAHIQSMLRSYEHYMSSDFGELMSHFPRGRGWQATKLDEKRMALPFKDRGWKKNMTYLLHDADGRSIGTGGKARLDYQLGLHIGHDETWAPKAAESAETKIREYYDTSGTPSMRIDRPGERFMQEEDRQALLEKDAQMDRESAARRNSVFNRFRRLMTRRENKPLVVTMLEKLAQKNTSLSNEQLRHMGEYFERKQGQLTLDRSQKKLLSSALNNLKSLELDANSQGEKAESVNTRDRRDLILKVIDALERIDSQNADRHSLGR